MSTVIEIQYLDKESAGALGQLLGVNPHEIALIEEHPITLSTSKETSIVEFSMVKQVKTLELMEFLREQNR